MRLTNTREAIHDALCWGHKQKGDSSLVEFMRYLTRIEKSIRAGDPCADFLEAAYICAAINVMAHIGGWLRFAYGPDDASDLNQHALACKLRDLLKPTTPRQNERFIGLGMVCLDDYKLRVWRERELPVEVYAQRLNVHSNHFSRDWAPRQRIYHDQIRRWDAEGIGYVSRMVVALRHGAPYTPSEVLLDRPRIAS